ncbi:hypothetical protein FOZ63_005039, partial [Perkinsus olseni]
VVVSLTRRSAGLPSTLYDGISSILLFAPRLNSPRYAQSYELRAATPSQLTARVLMSP